MRERLVQLVGCGPGDPELLTLKALRVIRAAHLVVHDRLVSDAVMDLVPPEIERIDVGKAPGRHALSQDAINDLLVELARPGLRVARLKGGDPLTFARGGEEILHLLRQGIRVEVVPGITSAQGCAAAVGMPLTHRGLATGLRYLTGTRRDGGWLDVDWTGLADPQTTLVVYMGLAQIGLIAARLIGAGLDPNTPALAVQDGTLPGQRLLRTTLDALPASVERARLRSPVLFVIGQVVSLLPEPVLAPQAGTEALLAQLAGW